MKRAGLWLVIIGLAAYPVSRVVTGALEQSRDARTSKGRDTARSTPPRAGRREGQSLASTIRVRGRVETEDGIPVPDALVTASREKDADRVTATSDERGGFELQLKSSSRVWMQVEHPIYLRIARWVTPRRDGEVVFLLRRGIPLTVLVLDPKLSPVNGAVVRARVQTLDEDTTDETRRTTGTDGRSQLGGMPKGRIEVTVRHAEFAPAVQTVILLESEARVHEVVLNRGGRITGHVVTSDGTPIVGARVWSPDHEDRAALTTQDGAFSIDLLPSGSVRLTAETKERGRSWFGYHLGWNEPVPIEVEEGRTTAGVRIVFGAPARIVGRVADETGAAVAGVRIIANFYNRPRMTVRLKSNADGSFAAGPFAVYGEARMRIHLRSTGHVIAAQATQLLRSGQLLDLGTIIATRCASISGTVRDSDGLPASGAWVRTNTTAASVAQDGTFTLNGVAPGRVAILAGMREGDQHWRSAEPVLDLKAGEVVAGIALRIARTRSSRGRVMDDRGRPVQRAHVAAVPESEERPPVARDPWRLTDKEGEFELQLLQGSYTVGIVRSNKGVLRFAETPMPVHVRAGEGVPTFVVARSSTIVRGRVLDKDDVPVNKFTATFIRFEGDTPRHYRTFPITAEDGLFEKELTPPGRWCVEIRAPGGGHARTVPIELGDGEIRDLGTIRLGGNGRFRGVVRDSAGAPVPFARVHLFRPDRGGHRAGPFTDSAGRFEMTELQPGRYIALALSPGHPFGVQRGIEVQRNRPVDVVIRFPESAPLHVLVRNEKRQPIPGARLRWTTGTMPPKLPKRFAPRGHGAMASDADGWIKKPHLSPGRYEIVIQAPGGYEPVSRTVTLTAGETQRVVIDCTRR